MQSPFDPNTPVPTEYVLAADPSVHVASIELGVTFYLADPQHWAERGAAAALREFLRSAPQELLRWYTTSRLASWKRVRADTLDEVLDAFSVDWLGRLRHGFEFVLADDVHSESVGFRYVEVDPKRVERTSLLELTLPAHFDPRDLARLADMVFDLGPVYAGIGGYALRYNAGLKGSAFTAGHGWAKRYLGMDIQARDHMPWLVRGAVPGVNWLNYIGAAFCAETGFDAAAFAARRFTQPISVVRDARGLRVMAGPAPTLVDLNRFEHALCYEELARALSERFVVEPPELAGEFARRDDSKPWFRRFLEPIAWR